MGSIRYNVSAGVLPITVDLIGASYSDSHTLYVYGEDTFYNVPLGTYVLLFTGDDGCTEESGPIYVVECTTTTTTTEEVYYYYANFYLCGCDNIGMNQPIKSYTPLEIGKFYFLDDIFGFDKIIEIVSEGGDGSELTFEPDGGPYNSCEETSLAECPTTTTTSTTCYLYRFFECGVYSIVNNTDEFVEFLYRDCYEEEWFGSVWLAPHGTSYYNPDCMEYMTYNCYLDVTLNNICTTTTTSTTVEPTTTTTTTEPTTTTTTTTCYVFYECAKYVVVNNTEEYRDVLYRDCGEEFWFGGISLGPHLEHFFTDQCYELLVDCGLDVYFSSECTTTTTTTVCPCDFAELTIAGAGTYGSPNNLADTYGTYCTESGKKYNCQIFDLGGPATIKRIGILGGKPVGSPRITIRALLLDTHLYAGRADDCGDVPPCPEVPLAMFPFNPIIYSSNSITFTEDNPDGPEWYYFCFDYHYDPAEHSGRIPSVAFVFSLGVGDVNDASNYVQFCSTGDTYIGGHYAYKINDLFSCAWGEPLEGYDLSVKICYDLDT